MVSQARREGFPQNIWPVTSDGSPVEAQLENASSGAYHGYPMPDTDPFSRQVLLKWRRVNE